jgi:hypothetical protein
MSAVACACPHCLCPLPACPIFGEDWRCVACRRLYIALPASDGSPQALDADHGVFGWSVRGHPVLMQASVPEWMTVKRASVSGR